MSSFAPLAPLLRTSMFGSIRPGRPLNRYRTAGRVGGGVPAGAPRTLAAFQQVQRFANRPRPFPARLPQRRAQPMPTPVGERIVDQGLGLVPGGDVLGTGAHKLAEVLGLSDPRMLAPDVDPGALDPLTRNAWADVARQVRASGGSLTPLQRSWLDTGGPPVPHAVTTGGGGSFLRAFLE